MVINNERVFVDSNFFIALFNPRDTLHAKAVTISERIRKEQPYLFISNFIFLETVTVLSQRTGRKAAVTLGERLLKEGHVEIIHIDKWLNSRSWEIFQKVRKKDISFVDCSTLAILELESIEKLLTFDIEDFSNLRKKFCFDFY